MILKLQGDKIICSAKKLRHGESKTGSLIVDRYTGYIIMSIKIKVDKIPQKVQPFCIMMMTYGPRVLFFGNNVSIDKELVI